MNTLTQEQLDELGLEVMGSKNFSERINAKANLSLDDLVDKSLDIQSKCQDITVNTKPNFIIDRFESKGRGLMSVVTSDGYNNFGYSSFFMTKHSLSQLCQKIGMNKTYYNTCYDKEAYSLLDTNMNYWLNKYENPLMIRTYDNYARGVLSDKFTIFDTPEILETLSDNQVLRNEYDLKGSYLSPERLHLRFTQDRKLFNDDDLFGGFTINSSDVGRNALEITFFVYKQVCTNGLCVPQYSSFAYKQKHIGLGYKDFKEQFVTALKGVDDFCDGIKEAISLSKKVKVDLSSEETVKKIVNISTLPKETVEEKVIPLIIDVYGNTSWGVVNAVTQVAQDYTLERRLELETNAGNLLTHFIAA